MDLEKIRHWLELTNQTQKMDFWNNIFEHSSPENIIKKGEDFPLYDIYQNDSLICILIEVPGINKDNISITLRQKTALIIQGTAQPLFPAQFELKKERYYGDFKRIIPLPEPADAQSIQYYFYDGILQITYPRQAESLTPIKFANNAKDSRLL